MPHRQWPEGDVGFGSLGPDRNPNWMRFLGHANRRFQPKRWAGYVETQLVGAQTSFWRCGRALAVDFRGSPRG
jgi:hypothetical protein